MLEQLEADDVFLVQEETLGIQESDDDPKIGVIRHNA